MKLFGGALLVVLSVWCFIAGWHGTPLSPSFVWYLFGLLCVYVAFLLFVISGDE